MNAQFSLDGFEADPAPTDRLFFALLPDQLAIDRVSALSQQLRRDHALTTRPIPAERLHVTLHHVGDYLGLPTHIVDAASQAASGLALAPFPLAFDRVATFSGKPGRLPWVLRGGEGLQGVMALQLALETALVRAGLAKSRVSFTPHLTLLYGDRQVDDQFIDPIAWTVSEFVLVRSLMGQGHHSVIGRWSLRP